ncbi:MAG: hypothetical protein K2M42_08875 [Oscillospiraceae bacterium]|nr:hypothetical protein [Oscillospiraceae bacterium]
MEKTYVASLCWHGLLGGWLILDDERVTYRTGKLQVPPEIRNLQLPFCRIKNVKKSKALFLPTVTIGMGDGREWKFLVFGRNGFLNNLKTAMDAYDSGD